MMRSWNHHKKAIFYRLIILSILAPEFLMADTKFWTGYGGNTDWANPLNWSGLNIPQSSDDVILDNSEMPLSYLVTLPDSSVKIRTLIVKPSPGQNIEIVLPASNKNANAFTASGPGYGIELNAGAIFRNASGISSGESLQIADSIIIYDGGKYIHQTRASHANGILRILSTAPGTEQGIFDFDVPRASYTISISNRIYGSLELNATAYGDTVNYTCTGSNPLLVRGNLHIGVSVNMSTDLSGANGNIQVNGDFIQDGGRLNLASGNGDNTILRIMGDIYQSPPATITETSNGSPWLELNGQRLQEVAMAGRLQNQVGFRMNNITGSILRMPLMLPWKLDLNQGKIISSINAMLILDTNCDIKIDSSRLLNTYVEGPLRKLGLGKQDYFLFPVGKDQNLRWLELKYASGNYTVEYFHENPDLFGSNLGPGLDHISKLEYWNVIADSTINNNTKIELSFASVQSGGVTDPSYLNVAEFQSDQWEDAGHEATTGNSIQGSVISGDIDFEAQDYTLASTMNLENPLPVTTIVMQVKEVSEKPVFSWTLESTEIPDHFDLFELINGQPVRLAVIPAIDQQIKYNWICNNSISNGDHFFRVSMIDVFGNKYDGEVVQFKMSGRKTIISRVVTGNHPDQIQLLVQSEKVDEWKYEILTMQGQIIKKGIMNLVSGNNYLDVGSEIISQEIYVFRAIDILGNLHSLLFRNK
jgi:hypothetical protein